MSELRWVHVDTCEWIKWVYSGQSSMDTPVRSLQVSTIFTKFHVRVRVRVRDLRAENDPFKRYLNVEL